MYKQVTTFFNADVCSIEGFSRFETPAESKAN